MVAQNYAQEIPYWMGVSCIRYRNGNMLNHTDKADLMELAEYIFDQINKDQIQLKDTRPQLSASGLYVTAKDIETYINDFLYYMEFKRSF